MDGPTAERSKQYSESEKLKIEKQRISNVINREKVNQKAMQNIETITKTQHMCHRIQYRKEKKYEI